MRWARASPQLPSGSIAAPAPHPRGPAETPRLAVRLGRQVFLGPHNPRGADAGEPGGVGGADAREFAREVPSPINPQVDAQGEVVCEVQKQVFPDRRCSDHALPGNQLRPGRKTPLRGRYFDFLADKIGLELVSNAMN